MKSHPCSQEGKCFFKHLSKDDFMRVNLLNKELGELGYEFLIELFHLALRTHVAIMLILSLPPPLSAA